MKQQKDDPETNHSLTEFQPYLDDVDIPADQKQAFLELIWSIMVEFVALGFGADATSQAIAAHMADASPAKSQEKLVGAFAAVQPMTNPKDDCC